MHTLWLGVNKRALIRVRLDPLPEVLLKYDAKLQFNFISITKMQLNSNAD